MVWDVVFLMFLFLRERLNVYFFSRKTLLKALKCRPFHPLRTGEGEKFMNFYGLKFLNAETNENPKQHGKNRHTLCLLGGTTKKNTKFSAAKCKRGKKSGDLFIFKKKTLFFKIFSKIQRAGHDEMRRRKRKKI